MLKGCIGFSHIQGSWIWTMLIVRGKHVKRVPLLYPFYLICNILWKKYYYSPALIHLGINYRYSNNYSYSINTIFVIPGFHTRI